MGEFGIMILDNREDITPFYDGSSMGGGVITFSCSQCDSLVEKETFTFLTRENKVTHEEKNELNDFFNTVKEPCFMQSAKVGFTKCGECGQVYGVYISFGEVQQGRYQTSLIAVAEYTR